MLESLELNRACDHRGCHGLVCDLGTEEYCGPCAGLAGPRRCAEDRLYLTVNALGDARGRLVRDGRNYLGWGSQDPYLLCTGVGLAHGTRHAKVRAWYLGVSQ